ncbi:hypothetical protein D3C87_1570340 [compost metagenome]
MCDEVQNGTADHERNEKAVKPIADKGRSAFAFNAFDNEQSGDQEHQRHEEYIVEVFENIQSYPATGIDNRMGGIDIDDLIKARESGISERRMMSNHQNCQK